MKFNAKKILTPGAILLALSAVLGLVAVILYAVNVSASGYFQGALVGIVPAMGVVSIVLALLAIGSGMVEVDGVLGQVLEYGRNVLMLLVPIFFMVSALAFIGARAEALPTSSVPSPTSLPPSRRRRTSPPPSRPSPASSSSSSLPSSLSSPTSLDSPGRRRSSRKLTPSLR